LPHFFTDRRKGSSLGVYDSLNFGFHVGDDSSAVVANRALLGNTQFMNQVHGNQVRVIDQVSSDDPTCDALITTTPGISLAVMVADCIPLLLISQKAVAAVHVGRAGLVNKVAVNAIEQMRNLGASDIHAILGPSICGKCYEVPLTMQQEVASTHPSSLSMTPQATPALDLPAGLISDLITQGLTFEASPICTKEDLLYYSHRRDNPTGRFAGVVTL
jgi:YfiH family protein